MDRWNSRDGKSQRRQERREEKRREEKRREEKRREEKRREEKRREEKRREEKKENQKDKVSEERQSRCSKGREAAKHCVFPMICGSGGSKSRLAKAAGAEPSGQMRDEKLHAVVARRTCGSQNVK